MKTSAKLRKKAVKTRKIHFFLKFPQKNLHILQKVCNFALVKVNNNRPDGVQEPNKNKKMKRNSSTKYTVYVVYLTNMYQGFWAETKNLESETAHWRNMDVFEKIEVVDTCATKAEAYRKANEIIGLNY